MENDKKEGQSNPEEAQGQNPFDYLQNLVDGEGSRIIDFEDRRIILFYEKSYRHDARDVMSIYVGNQNLDIQTIMAVPFAYMGDYCDYVIGIEREYEFSKGNVVGIMSRTPAVLKTEFGDVSVGTSRHTMIFPASRLPQFYVSSEEEGVKFVLAIADTIKQSLNQANNSDKPQE